MSRWRDLSLVVVLFVILIGFTVYGTGRSERDDSAPAGSVHSARDNGALALRSWLQALGYTASPLQYTEWQIPSDVHALFMLAPQTNPITPEEAEETLRWVRSGGTLILIVTEDPSLLLENALLQALGAQITVPDPDASPTPTPVAVTQPVLNAPPASRSTVDARASITLDRTDYIPLLATDDGNLLVGFAEDRGYVYLGTSVLPFTNGSIREPDNPALVLNLLRRVPQGGRILFDEYHHGFQRAPTTGNRMLDYWWGWAGLYAMIVTGLYLLLSGRRFGRAVPLPQDVARRSSAEYVESLAAIFRRAGKHAYIAQQHHDRFKRRIARSYGFVPPPDDQEFLHELERYAAPSDEQLAQIRRVLDQLRQVNSDQQLVRAVRDAVALINEQGRLR